METAKKIDHSKDKYYLPFAMRNFLNFSCPLDNKLIKNGYIDDKGMYDYGISNSDNRQFKCFSLHPIIDGEDIVDYTYGNIGYDLNPESMKIYVGGWDNLCSNNVANKLANDTEFLSTKKNGNLYLGKDHVDQVMYKKILNRAKLLKETIRASKNKDPQEILQAMFGGSNKSDDDSFCEKNNYHLENEGDIWKLKGPSLLYATTFEEYGVGNAGTFKLFYNEKNDKLYFDNAGELDGIAIDKTKGIKVDRIFVLESELQELQYKQQKIGGDYYKGIYDRYINKLTDVLIQQFPFGEIRVVKGNIKEGQKNEFLLPEEFINQYFVNKYDKKKYLKKLEIKRKEVNKQNGRNNEVSEERQQDKKGNEINNQNDYSKKLESKRKEVKLKENNSEKKEEQNVENGNNPNIRLECYIEQPQQLTKEEKFKDILNGFNLIKEKLGEPEFETDPKSKKNKIFLNEKWYDRMHWTEKSIVKSEINKVFASYCRSEINDEDAKRQLNNIVKSHRRFFNSTYC